MLGFESRSALCKECLFCFVLFCFQFVLLLLLVVPGMDSMQGKPSYSLFSGPSSCPPVSHLMTLKVNTGVGGRL